MKSTNIRNILLFPFSVLIMCFSATVALVSLYNSQSYINDLLREAFSYTKSNIFSDLSHLLQSYEQISYSNSVFIQQLRTHDSPQTKEKISLLLKQQLAQSALLDGIYIQEDHSVSVGFIRAEDQLYPIEKTSLSHNVDTALLTRDKVTKEQWLSPIYLPELHQSVLRYRLNIPNAHAQPLHQNIQKSTAKQQGQRPVRTVNAIMSLDRLNSSLIQNLKEHPGFAFIVDSNEHLIAHSNLPHSGLSENNQTRFLTSVLAHTKNSSDNNFRYGKNQYRIASFNMDTITSFNWRLIILLEETAAHRQATSYTQNALITIICGMLLTMLLSGYLANQIAKPIRYLNNRLLSWNEHSAANEDIPHSHPGIQELQQLASSVTQLQNRVSSTMQELHKTISENLHFINEIEKLALVAENTDDMVLICDPQAQIEWANESFLNKYQYQPDDILHCKLSSILRCEQSDQNGDIAFIFKALEHRNSACQQQIHVNKSGATHWVHINIHKIRDNHRNVRHYIVIMQDITEQKRYESELAKWKTLFYAADWGIAFLEGPEQRMSLVNPAYAKHHGYALEALINRPGSICYPSQVHEKIQKYYAVAEQKGSVTFETEHVKSNGKPFPVIQNISAYYNQNGQIGGLISSIQDVSEIKSLQSQLIQSQKMEAMGTLAGGMAHDFNNILASILGNAELSDLYLDMIPNHHQSEYYRELQTRLSAIVKACNRASDLTSKILSYSRMAPTDFAPLKLKDVLDEAVTLIEPVLPANIDIEINIVNDRDYISGNESQLQQVFVNLLTNAIHAIQAIERPEGKIIITMENTTGEGNQPLVKLTFFDNGCGIPAESLGHIFDPFFTTREKGKGTGLGLSVVMGIMQAHKVHVSVASEPSLSTEFTLQFPVTRPLSHHCSASNAQSNKTPPSAPLHLIMIDDEAPLLEVWQQLLTSQGYRVTTFEQPKQALKEIKNAPDTIDLIITDYDMEGMTGETLCEIVNREHPQIPLVMLTGYSGKMNEIRANELGIKQLLKKPIALSALLHAVNLSVKT